MDKITFNLKNKFRDVTKDNLYTDVDIHGHSVVEAQYMCRIGYEDNPDVCALPRCPTTEEIMSRHKIMDSLAEHEKAFGEQLLGFKMSDGSGEPSKAEEQNEQESSSTLHLMNAAAPVFPCTDPIRTALFYEQKLGFKAAHLDDERMPHIRLTRDNIAIALVSSPVRIAPVSMYELIIYVSEPLLLLHELKAGGVKIIEDLPEAKASQGALSNRQFVFEDCDGRKICVSQSSEVV